MAVRIDYRGRLHEDDVVATGVFSGATVSFEGTVVSVQPGRAQSCDWSSMSRSVVSWDSVESSDVSQVIDGQSGILQVGLTLDGDVVTRVSDSPWKAPVIHLSRIGVADGALLGVAVQEGRPVRAVAEQLHEFMFLMGQFIYDGLELMTSGDRAFGFTSGSGFRLGSGLYSGAGGHSNLREWVDGIVPGSSLSLHRNGSGGTVVAPIADLDPSRYDDGSGSLIQVSANNRWTVSRIYLSPSSGVSIVVYGQDEYGGRDQARDAVLEGRFDATGMTGQRDLVRRAVVLHRANWQNWSQRNRYSVLWCNRFGGLGGV